MKRKEKHHRTVDGGKLPPKTQKEIEDMLNQKYEDAIKINKKLEQLHNAMFLESNPIPVKWLLSYLGKINSKIRLPLVSLDEKYHQKLITAYEASL